MVVISKRTWPVNTSGASHPDDEQLLRCPDLIERDRFQRLTAPARAFNQGAIVVDEGGNLPEKHDLVTGRE
jgi:hypothetical protein